MVVKVSEVSTDSLVFITCEEKMECKDERPYHQCGTAKKYPDEFYLIDTESHWHLFEIHEVL